MCVIVVLFEGLDKNQRMLFEVYILDTTNWTWTKLENQREEDGPAAMASASMAPLTQDRCIVFGGAGLAHTGYKGGYSLVPKDDRGTCGRFIMFFGGADSCCKEDIIQF